MLYNYPHMKTMKLSPKYCLQADCGQTMNKWDTGFLGLLELARRQAKLLNSERKYLALLALTYASELIRNFKTHTLVIHKIFSICSFSYSYFVPLVCASN